MKSELLTFLQNLYQKKEENTIPIHKSRYSLIIGLILFVVAAILIVWMILTQGQLQEPLESFVPVIGRLSQSIA